MPINPPCMDDEYHITHLFFLFAADKGTYQRVGEATEVALRVLTEKIGLLGYASHALDSLSRVERATYCNDHWQTDYQKVRGPSECTP